MAKIKTVYDLQNGDIIFKNTEMNDRGKNFFMRIINELTTGVQNIQRKIKGLPSIKGRDHTEFFLWNGTIPETHSSVSGSGVRSQNFLKWMQREGYPAIEILRRPEAMTVEEVAMVSRQICIDRGIPYGTIPAIKEGLSLDHHEPVDLDLMVRGIFCSESTKRYAGFKPFTGMWPAELYDFLVINGYFLVFKGSTRDLIN